MKILRIASAFLLILSIASCSNDSSENNSNLMNLKKKVTFVTESAFPESNTKRVTWYTNNEAVTDTVFDYQNHWVSRSIVSVTGNTKEYKTFDTSGQLTGHREEIYDSQGRILSRRTYLPLNIIKVAFTYNDDGTVTANAIDVTNQNTTYIATYHKNADGVIYKEFKPTAIAPITTVERTLVFDGLKPISQTSNPAGTPITFDYYPNPMPSNITKSAIKLNNRMLLALSLTRLAEEGNFYYKRNDTTNSNGTTTYQTDFNSHDYIEHYKYLNINITNGSQSQTESFYYYE